MSLLLVYFGEPFRPTVKKKAVQKQADTQHRPQAWRFLHGGPQPTADESPNDQKYKFCNSDAFGNQFHERFDSLESASWNDHEGITDCAENLPPLPIRSVVVVIGSA